MNLGKLAALRGFVGWAERVYPKVLLLSVFVIAFGFVWGLFFAPADYEQGDAYRIIYVHVPAAWLSLFVYMVMAFMAVLALVWRIRIAELACLECARIGASFTLLALLTGMIWGRPMWGAFWAWDARLVSELVLLFIYIGVISLATAIPNPGKAARVACILVILGVVNVPIVHFSVEWWNTLHQGPTVTRFATPAAHPDILWPLLTSAAGFMMYFLGVLLLRLCHVIAMRQQAAG